MQLQAVSLLQRIEDRREATAGTYRHKHVAYKQTLAPHGPVHPSHADLQLECRCTGM